MESAKKNERRKQKNKTEELMDRIVLNVLKTIKSQIQKVIPLQCQETSWITNIERGNITIDPMYIKRIRDTVNNLTQTQKCRHSGQIPWKTQITKAHTE